MSKVTPNSDGSIVQVSLPRAEIGRQGPTGDPGPSGSVGPNSTESGSVGPQGPPHNLLDTTTSSSFTNIPITASIISASFTGSLYGTSSWSANEVPFAISASYTLQSSGSTEGFEAIEILDASPKQLDFNIVNQSTGSIKRNEYYASTNLKWSFVAPISGKVILTIGRLRWVAHPGEDTSPNYTGGPRISISETSPVSSSIIISENDIDDYGPFTNVTRLWDTDFNVERSSVNSPINLLKSGLTPGNSYTFYLYTQAYLTSADVRYSNTIEFDNTYLQATSVVTTT